MAVKPVPSGGQIKHYFGGSGRFDASNHICHVELRAEARPGDAIDNEVELAVLGMSDPGHSVLFFDEHQVKPFEMLYHGLGTTKAENNLRQRLGAGVPFLPLGGRPALYESGGDVVHAQTGSHIIGEVVADKVMGVVVDPITVVIPATAPIFI